jgi:CBS domain containing-hemolysin-like protein
MIARENTIRRRARMAMRLPRPRHGDPEQATHELRELAAAVLADDIQTLARTTAYLRRSYRAVFASYVAMLAFGLAAVAAAFVKGLTATSVADALAAIGLAGMTVGIFVAFFIQRPSAALERNAIFMPWVSIVLTTFWTRMLYLDDPATLDAQLGKAAKDASEELSAIAARYAAIDHYELSVAREAARTRPRPAAATEAPDS